ncbi:MAG: helix-turn-helix domain-containing protein, partial [Dehalococcoidia bacterium]
MLGGPSYEVRRLMGEIGEALRTARLDLGVDLRRASADTRISRLFLEALEEERFSELPAAVYVRGFLRSYAGYLGLDGQRLIDQLPEPFAAPPASPQVGFVPGPGRRQATVWPPRPGGEDTLEEAAVANEGDPESPAGAAPGLFPGRRTVGGRKAPREEPLGHLPPAVPHPDPRLPTDRGEGGNQLLGLLLLLFAVIIAVGVIGGFLLIITRGGGGEPLGAGAGETPTPASRTQTVVPPQGSTPTPDATGSITPGSGSPAPSRSPGLVTPPPTFTPAPRPTSGGANPTSTPPPTSTPASTPGEATPTATPTP